MADLVESFDELCGVVSLLQFGSPSNRLGFVSDLGSRVSIFLRFVHFNSSSMLKFGFEIEDSIEENNFTIYLRFFLSLI